MKNINTTPLKTIITIAALLIVNFSFGKTYIAINSGKWSDASTWQTEAPGNTISADDEVIIKNHITMNTDVAVSGTLTVEKGNSVMSNKTLVITSTGKLVNNGNITVKRIVNEGTINNNAMIESMNDVENKGNVNNNANMVAGTNLLNFGGNVAGNQGTYFANGTVVSSPTAKFGNNVKIYANPSQATSMTDATADMLAKN
jgi:hypothetical protein